MFEKKTRTKSGRFGRFAGLIAAVGVLAGSSVASADSRTDFLSWFGVSYEGVRIGTRRLSDRFGFFGPGSSAELQAYGQRLLATDGGSERVMRYLREGFGEGTVGFGVLEGDVDGVLVSRFHPQNPYARDMITVNYDRLWARVDAPRAAGLPLSNRTMRRVVEDATREILVHEGRHSRFDAWLVSHLKRNFDLEPGDPLFDRAFAAARNTEINEVLAFRAERLPVQETMADAAMFRREASDWARAQVRGEAYASLMGRGLHWRSQVDNAIRQSMVPRWHPRGGISPLSRVLGGTLLAGGMVASASGDDALAAKYQRVDHFVSGWDPSGLAFGVAASIVTPAPTDPPNMSMTGTTMPLIVKPLGPPDHRHTQAFADEQALRARGYVNVGLDGWGWLHRRVEDLSSMFQHSPSPAIYP